jgi:hypothetical protein
MGFKQQKALSAQTYNIRLVRSAHGRLLLARAAEKKEINLFAGEIFCFCASSTIYATSHFHVEPVHSDRADFGESTWGLSSRAARFPLD